MTQDHGQPNAQSGIFVKSGQAWASSGGYARFAAYYAVHLAQKLVRIFPRVNVGHVRFWCPDSFGFVFDGADDPPKIFIFHAFADEHGLVLSRRVVALIDQPVGRVVVGAGQAHFLSVEVHFHQEKLDRRVDVLGILTDRRDMVSLFLL